MKLSLEKLKPYGFNEKVFSLDDAYMLCESEGITVYELDVPTSFYFVCMGKPFIVLKKGMKGLKKLFSLLHEISHHFLHGGTDSECAFFFGMLENKNEIEADAFALIGMIPLSALSTHEFLETHPNFYARKLFKDRQKLNFLYGI